MLGEGRSGKAEWDHRNLNFFHLLLKAAAPLFALWIYTYGNDQIASNFENVTCINYKKLSNQKIFPTNRGFHLLLRFVGFNSQTQSSMLVDVLNCFQDRLWCWITLLGVFWKAWCRTTFFFFFNLVLIFVLIPYLQTSHLHRITWNGGGCLVLL